MLCNQCQHAAKWKQVVNNDPVTKWKEESYSLLVPLQIQDSSQWATFFKHCQRILNPDVSSDFLLLPLVLSQRDLWRWVRPAPKERAVNHTSGLKQSRIWWVLQCGWRVPPSCKCSIQDHLTNNKGEDKQAVPGLLFKTTVCLITR